MAKSEYKQSDLAVMVAEQVEIRPELVPRWLSIEVRHLLHYRQLLYVYETAT